MTADAQQVERLRELLAAATPGPWEVIWNAVAYVDTIADPNDLSGQTPMQEPVKVADASEADRNLIAEAITALPDLLATAEAHAALVKAVEGLAEPLCRAICDLLGEPRVLVPGEVQALLDRILAATDTADRGAR